MTRYAIVHEWFDTYAGSEKVVEQMLALYPEADLFSVVDFLPDHARAFLGGRRARTTFIQGLPWARRRFRAYLPLMPFAIEQLDLSGYDVVISSNHAVAKGVITGPDQLHVSYVHSPMRYAWDLQHQYLREAGIERGPRSWLTRYLLHRLRGWDVRSSHGVDRFVANSSFVARRIRKVYRRDAEVVHPPVDVEAFPLRRDKEDVYLAASRFVPYKRMDLIVRAFASMPDRRLIVIGDGQERARAQALAGPNTTFLGRVDHDVLRDHMQRARALLFAAEEDFGIVPVEAMACGTPVIAFGRGGVLDTVRGLDDTGPTGVFFDAQTEEGVRDAVARFEAAADRFDPERIRARASEFAIERFRERFRSVVSDAWSRFRASSTPGA